MQDRFRYRVFDNDDKKMHDVIFINYENNSVEWYNDNNKKRAAFIEEVPTVQCTGLKDKNGKLIYEGNIVKAITRNPYEEYIGVIQYHSCYFSLDYKEVGKYGECGISLTKNTSDFATLEILGNRYENPELLKNKK